MAISTSLKGALIVKGDKPNANGFASNQAIATANSPIGPSTSNLTRYWGLTTFQDGFDWQRADHYKVMNERIEMVDGTVLVPDRMERPFVYVEGDQPTLLCPAIKKGDDAFTVFVPMSNDSNTSN